MFENLSNRLTALTNNLRGRGRLTEENIQNAVRDVRMALLEADVALPVVKHFITQVRERALGTEVTKSLSPGQAFIQIVKDELISVMGTASEGLSLNAQPPAVILLAGLQGAGKTTTAAKLAKLLKQENKQVLLASCDVYRPAAIDQLQTLAEQIDVGFFKSDDKKPIVIAKAALQTAQKQFADVLLVDTAGRLHIDDAMMEEIRQIHTAISPVETLFVVDSMTGQDAANTAKAFSDALTLTGVVLTKVDGDARGGAALSIRQITGKPIKFLGEGEKLDNLELFHPDRMASRILGMGDVLSLIENVEQQIDLEKAQQLSDKVKTGKAFNLEDLRNQLHSMEKMGGIAGLVDKLPGMGNMAEMAKQQVGDRKTQQMLAIIDSMTVLERRKPDVISGSRKKRIAAGSGTQIQDVNRLLKQHKQMSKMMKKMAKGGMSKMMRHLQSKMPPGFG